MHLKTHTRITSLIRSGFKRRDCTADHCPLLHCLVRRGANGTQDPLQKKGSFSTSTDGFRRHGASREAALDSKMLLKAVLIVCVVRKERKADYCARPREFLFPSQSGRRGGAQTCKGGREDGWSLCCASRGTTLGEGDSHFLGPRSYDASGEVGGYLYKPLRLVLLHCCIQSIHIHTSHHVVNYSSRPSRDQAP